jgi:uncharacterized protein YggE
MSKRSHFSLFAAVVTIATLAAPGALGATAAGAAGAAAGGRTITVVGVGQVRGTPDVADLSLGVSGRGASAADVLATISDRAQKVIDALHGAGVADDDIQTSNLSVQPVVDDQNHITGYQATNTVIARIRDLSKAGAIVDAAAAKAGDSIRVDGISFSIDDDSKLLAAARTKATKRARVQAEQLAAGAGVQVGDVQSISESTTVPVDIAPAAGVAAAAPTPIQPGTETLSVSATVVFAIR